jgi:hypothetical protein
MFEKVRAPGESVRQAGKLSNLINYRSLRNVYYLATNNNNTIAIIVSIIVLI